MKYEVETKCIHLEQEQKIKEQYGSVSFPIYQTSTFAHHGIGGSTGYDYSRLQNPTREQLERVVAELEEGVASFAFSSGMAAIATVMELFRPGDHVIIDLDLYGGSTRLFQNITQKNGVEFTGVDCSKEDIRPHIRPNTKAVFIETPTNPMMNVTDIQALSRLTKEQGLLLIVDNTFLSPYFQNPLVLGADVVIHSGTKFLGGHNDTLAGFIVAGTEELAEQFRFLIKTTGACLAPFDSWLILRGIKTLAVRMERAQENAIQLVEWLQKQPEVKKVYYPGLKDHPGYEINANQTSGAGSMISFQVDSEETARTLLEKVQLITYAESLGGVESLITYPMLQTHGDVPVETRERLGITETFLRLSVGIENCEDLIRDLDQAING